MSVKWQMSIKGEPCDSKLFSSHSMSFNDELSDVTTSRIDYGGSKDDKYWDRRRRNNVAAKKSRDARRVRENQVRPYCTYLFEK